MAHRYPTNRKTLSPYSYEIGTHSFTTQVVMEGDRIVAANLVNSGDDYFEELYKKYALPVELLSPQPTPILQR